jgi:predicted transcriptional regulator
MTLILEISPETEARIRMNATVRGQDVAEYITALTENDQVIDLTEFEDQADFDDSVAGIREGLADLEAGRTYSLEETFAFLENDKAEWQREQAEKHSRPQSAAVSQ